MPGGNQTINIFDNTGSQLAGAPFGNVPTAANNYGIEASIRPSKKITIFGWAGYTQAIAVTSPRQSAAQNGGPTLTGPKGAKADIYYYAAGIAFPDFGKQGSLLGFLFGVPPRVTSNNQVRETSFGNRRRVDNGVTYQGEVFYRYQLTDNVAINPGAYVLINPEANSRNSADIVGTLRTTFTF